MTRRDTLDDLLDAVRGYLATMKTGELAEAISCCLAQLDTLPAQRHLQPAQQIPVCRWLEPALARAEHGPGEPIACALRPLAPLLRWERSYQWRDDLAHFFENYGWADLVGPRGFVPSDQITLGLLLLGPQTFYPPHAHPATEIYLPLAGTARWQQGDEPPAYFPPGACILHRSWVSHAMASGDEPLLALYAWRGDLNTPAAFSEP